MRRAIAISMFWAGSACAQVVEAHYGQSLVTAAMSANPGLQKMGIHAAPLSGGDEIIVACSVPSKIGKKSSAADLEEERSGKPFVKTAAEKKFYDLALPLADAKGRAIGAVVMEMRFSGASSPEDAVAKAETIRDGLQKRIASRDALFGPAPSSDPLVLVRTTPLPDITGDFDHFAIDRERNRLYLSAEVHHSIEVFDLRSGEHLKSLPIVTTPHTLAFVPEKGWLLVADGGDNSCRIFDAGSGLDSVREVKRIPLAADPDAGYYDAAKRIFYVGNGGRGAKEAFSFVSMISVDSASEIGRIRLEANNLESMAMDAGGGVLYVNLRDKNQVAVVDLETKAVREVWSIAGLNLNTPSVFDSAKHRLFVAGRKPGKLFVIDTASGKLVATLDCVETADDMAFDAASGRIYVTGAGGVTGIHQDSADKYSLVTQFDTNSGKTSVLDTAAGRLFIAHTKTDFDGAGLQVYAVQ